MKILNSAKTILDNEIQIIGKECYQDNILIVGVFHGDEPQGKFLIDKYLAERYHYYTQMSKATLLQEQENGKAEQTMCKNNVECSNNLLFIPCLNPDGMQNNTRTNANGVDLNRNFPTKNWGQNKGDNATCDDDSTDYFGGKTSASEIETKFIIKAIEKYSPKLILTMHAPYKVVNYDGPAENTAQKISEIIKYPAESSIGYPTPGSFGTYCGVERNIPTITLELDEECPVENLVEPVWKIFDYLVKI